MPSRKPIVFNDSGQLTELGSGDTLEASVFTYDTSLVQDANDGSHTYYAWPRVDGTGYKAVKYSLETSGKVGEVRDVLPIPADLSTLTYT